MQGTPVNFDIVELKRKLNSIKGVTEVSKLHVWSLNQEQVMLSVHITSTHPGATLKTAKKLCEKFGVYQSTIEVKEPKNKSGHHLHRKQYSRTVVH